MMLTRQRKGFDSGPGSTYQAGPMRDQLIPSRWILAVLIALPTTALAQGEEKAPEAASVSAARDDAKRSDAELTRLGEIDPGKLTTPQKQQQTETMLSEMRSALARGTELLKEARAAKDIVQLNCVNEKLTQVKGLVRLAEQSSVGLYEASANGVDDAINHEYTKIAVAHQKVKMLRGESELCVGEKSIYSGETEVLVEIDDNIPQIDPTVPIAPPPGPSSPPVASGV